MPLRENRMDKKGIPETAMLAAGHSSVQMHQRYIHSQRADVAKTFGILQHGCNTDFPAKRGKL
jgi:hypothetical protein